MVVLTLTLAMLLQASVVHTAPRPVLPEGFFYVEKENPEYKTYSGVRRKAIALIRAAGTNTGNNLSAAAITRGEEVIQALDSAEFAVSTNASSEAICKNNDSAFFVNAIWPGVIFICGPSRIALTAHVDAKNLLMAAQLLIHEGMHLIDYKKFGRSEECSATYFELLIMENNYGRRKIPTMSNRDAYKKQCGFEEYDDVPSTNREGERGL